MNIVEVRADDVELFAAWHTVLHVVDAYDRGPTADTWTLAEMRAEFEQASSSTTRRGYAALEDGAVVGAGWLALRRKDNLHRAELYVAVLPEHRRRSIGSVLIRHLEALAREDGRTVAGAEADWAYDVGPSGTGAPGMEFLAAHGYTCALVDLQRWRRLPVPSELLAEFAAEAAERHASYTLRSWEGPVPEELVADWASLSASLETEAPMGGLELEAHATDVALVRESEQLLAAQGRRKLHTVALDETGRVVAYTDIAAPLVGSDRAYQWGTLVRRDHRGHRLGLAIKVANLRQLQQLRPDLDLLVTYNAASNAHMVQVNDRLGFTPVEWLGEFQKSL